MNGVSSTLPFPILRHLLLTCDPVTLYKISSTHPKLQAYAYKLRGLPIDTLIINPSSVPLSFSHLKRPRPPLPYLFETPSGSTELQLKCTVPQLMKLAFFDKVTIWKSVVLKHLNDEVADVIKLLRIQEGCGLRLRNCEFSTKIWKKLLKLKWSGFECDAKQPPIDYITTHLLNLEKIDISLYSAFYDEVEMICKWKQKKDFKHVTFHYLFAALYPKLIAEFIEEKLHKDSSIEIIYHPEINKSEIDFFQKSLIKWLNKASVDWAMVGRKGVKKKLLIKLGHGSGDERFEAKFNKYIAENAKISTKESAKNFLTKTATKFLKPIKRRTGI